MKRKVVNKYLIIFLIAFILGAMLLQRAFTYRRSINLQNFEKACHQGIEIYEAFGNKNKGLNYIETWYFKEMDYAYLLDEEFKFLYHPNRDFIGNTWTSVGIDKFLSIQNEMMADKKKMTFNFTYDDVEKVSMIYKTKNDMFIVFHGNISDWH